MRLKIYSIQKNTAKENETKDRLVKLKTNSEMVALNSSMSKLLH